MVLDDMLIARIKQLYECDVSPEEIGEYMEIPIEEFQDLLKDTVRAVRKDEPLAEIIRNRVEAVLIQRQEEAKAKLRQEEERKILAEAKRKREEEQNITVGMRRLKWQMENINVKDTRTKRRRKLRPRHKGGAVRYHSNAPKLHTPPHRGSIGIIKTPEPISRLCPEHLSAYEDIDATPKRRRGQYVKRRQREAEPPVRLSDEPLVEQKVQYIPEFLTKDENVPVIVRKYRETGNINKTAVYFKVDISLLIDFMYDRLYAVREITEPPMPYVHGVRGFDSATNPTTRKMLAVDYNLGLEIPTIANKYRFSRDDVSDTLKCAVFRHSEALIQAPDNMSLRECRTKLPEATVSRLIADYKAGMRLDRAALKYMLTPEWAIEILRKNGVVLRRRMKIAPEQGETLDELLGHITDDATVRGMAASKIGLKYDIAERVIFEFLYGEVRSENASQKMGKKRKKKEVQS